MLAARSSIRRTSESSFVVAHALTMRATTFGADKYVGATKNVVISLTGG